MKWSVTNLCCKRVSFANFVILGISQISGISYDPHEIFWCLPKCTQTQNLKSISQSSIKKWGKKVLYMCVNQISQIKIKYKLYHQTGITISFELSITNLCFSLKFFEIFTNFTIWGILKILGISQNC